MSGLLRPQILELLADVKNNNGEVYAALYELNDPELKAALKALGKKCHLILANGAFSKKNDNDENKAVRAEMKSVVDLYDRLVPEGHFAHNKFLVCCDSTGKPQRVLSGSTNWTMTGLCTQANNGIIVNDQKLAQDFLDEWNLLKQAKNSYPPTLATANSKANTLHCRRRHHYPVVRADQRRTGSGLCAPADQRGQAGHPFPVLQSRCFRR